MYAVPREGGNSATKRCRLEGKGDYAGEWKSGNLGRVLGGGTLVSLFIYYSLSSLSYHIYNIYFSHVYIYVFIFPPPT